MNLMLLLAATVWMAPNGNDETGDGLARKPVATLKRVVEITRTVLTDEDKKIVGTVWGLSPIVTPAAISVVVNRKCYSAFGT